MSNCVTIHNGELRFRTDELDAAALVKEMEQHEGHDYYRGPCKGKEDEQLTSLRCYLLAGTRPLLGKKHIDLSGMREPKITVRLDKFAHTFRDLKQTLWLVSQYLKHSKAIMLELEDEDMESGRFYAQILLEPGKWPVSKTLCWHPDSTKMGPTGYGQGVQPV